MRQREFITEIGGTMVSPTPFVRRVSYRGLIPIGALFMALVFLLPGASVECCRQVIGRVDISNAKGWQLEILKASTEAEIDTAFATAAQRYIGAVVVGDPLFDSLSRQVVAPAAQHAVPAIYISRKYVADGGLISYGAIFTTPYQQVGNYAGSLNGAKPADLPVQQSTNFELVINLNTARRLGLTVPPSLLARADEVIE